jgi:hypothetical protein
MSQGTQVRGAINNPEAFLAARWDWSFLNGCFGETRISPTDIDACVERHGHLLYIENKPFNGSVSGGQAMVFDAIRRKGDAVLVIYGRQESPPYRMQIWPGESVPATLDSIRTYVAAWFMAADGI